MLRLTVAAVAVTAVAAPALPAFAEPDPPRPVCSLHWTDDPWITTSSDSPVQFSIGRPYWVC